MAMCMQELYKGYTNMDVTIENGLSGCIMEARQKSERFLRCGPSKKKSSVWVLFTIHNPPPPVKTSRARGL